MTQFLTCSVTGNGNDTVIFKSVMVTPDHLQISKNWNLSMDCYNSKCMQLVVYH